MADRPWHVGPRLSGPRPKVPDDIEAYPNHLPQSEGSGLRIGIPGAGQPMYAPGPLLRFGSDPDLYRPPTGTYFNVQGRNTGQALADGEVTLATFNIPVNNVGIVGTFFINAQVTLATTDIRFRLKENMAVKQGWDVEIAPQTAAAVNQGYDGEFVRIPFVDGAEVTLTAQVNDAGTYDVWAQAIGYFYSKELRAAWGAQ